jgi:hypothetical protein
MPRRKDHPEYLSTKPAQIRNRLRRNFRNKDMAAFKQDLELYQQHTGFKPPQEWDMEELSRGRPRNKNGHFGGRVPGWITPEIVKESKKLLHERTFGKLTSNVELAVKTIRGLMTNVEVDEKGKPVVDSRTKLAAAQFVIDHVLGKPQTILELTAVDDVRQMFASAIVLDNGREDSHLVIEGAVVDEDEEDE